MEIQNNHITEDAFYNNTSTRSTSANNSGESVPQDPDQIVNEQEQNKPVNPEEFIDTAPQIAQNADPVKNEPLANEPKAKEEENDDEIAGDTDASKKKITIKTD